MTFNIVRQQDRIRTIRIFNKVRITGLGLILKVDPALLGQMEEFKPGWWQMAERIVTIGEAADHVVSDFRVYLGCGVDVGHE